MKTASKSYQKNPTNTNARKLEKAQYQLTGIYLKEQAEYVQNQIDKIRDSVEDRQSNGSNGNEGVFHTFQISRTGTSISDAI